MAAGTRLLDLIPLLEADFRVQVALTIPHAGEEWHGLDTFARETGMLIVPWHQATRLDWDLVLTASHRHIDQLHGKVLVLPHGASAMRSRCYSRKAGGATRPTSGLDRELLTYRGRVIPSALALTHDHELRTLRKTCPEALPAAVVTGDICLDRMLASLPFRDHYRAALGLAEHQRLITISSTWSTDSTFGQHTDIYERLLDELVDAGHSTRVAAVLHPQVWSAHAPWQVRSWLRNALGKGMLLVPPDEGWRAAMIASDLVIGDHGSTTSYAAAIGRPIALATFPHQVIRQHSLAATLARHAPLLDHDRPLLPQLAAATTCDTPLANSMSARLGAAARLFRSAMYRLLGLPEPPWPPPTSPVPLPHTHSWR
ncbi:hypothetical protein [Actinophytocola sp.]|uniref:hypothetical protein n=1 Tax=Actinophytocola sp. TaxID=1872138 RepID=UPI003D6AAEE7